LSRGRPVAGVAAHCAPSLAFFALEALPCAIFEASVPGYKLKLGSKTMVVPDGQHDIGRIADCWLTLDDELASRHHARLHAGGGVLEIEDLGSRNGTFINGARLDGRTMLRDGDRIRIGRELIAVLDATSTSEEEEQLRRTLAPGEDTRFPSLVGQLVEKSLKVGKIKDAERYANALLTQLGNSKVAAQHPAAESCMSCLLSIAERTSNGVWIDRVFRLHATQKWIMSNDVLDRIRAALDRIPRVPGTGMADYERSLRTMAREGEPVPSDLTGVIAELADAYGGG
jgi:pSer/pThr/pTyr-binding forkhead associated (FHA) protein